MPIEISRPSREEMQNKGVLSWPIWEKEASRFDWYYDETEECYLIEGKVTVKTKDGKQVEFGKGDFVRFPKGLDCEWDITVPVKKHYNFQ
jgi:uncharacterized cupin superfamily protein